MTAVSTRPSSGVEILDKMMGQAILTTCHLSLDTIILISVQLRNQCKQILTLLGRPNLYNPQKGEQNDRRRAG